MSELKPCPFCGYEHPAMTMNSIGVYISCPNCQTKFRCDCTAGHDYDRNKTIKRWNRRDQPANEPLALEQLEQMKTNGEPVWMEKAKEWIFVASISEQPYAQVWYFTAHGKAKTILFYHEEFYRCPPERREK